MILSNNIHAWFLSAMILLHILGTNGELTERILTNHNITKDFKTLKTNFVLDGQKCSKNGINVTHSITEDIPIEEGNSTTIAFDFPMDFQYYSCLIFRPNETFKYVLTDDCITNGSCISFSKDNYLQDSVNSTFNRLSVRNSDIEISIQTQAQNSCLIDIKNVTKYDYGTWKVVLVEGIPYSDDDEEESGSGIPPEVNDQNDEAQIHIFSKVLKVKIDGDWREVHKKCQYGSVNKTTKKFCDSPKPQYGGKNCSCDDSNESWKICNGTYAEIIEPCPVDGGWGIIPGQCDCDQRINTSTLLCNEPKPQYGGKNCTCLPLDTWRNCNGSYAEVVQTCDQHLCLTNTSTSENTFVPETSTLSSQPIDGGWKTEPVQCDCGQKTKKVILSCNSPAPQHDGRNCPCVELNSWCYCNGTYAEVDELCDDKTCTPLPEKDQMSDEWPMAVLLTLISLIILIVIILILKERRRNKNSNEKPITMKAVCGEQITKESKLKEDPKGQTSSTLEIKANE